MHRSDMQAFTDALTGCIEALGGRTPTDASMKTWWEVLKGFPAPDVIGTLDWWARNRTKPPAPADIHDRVAERAIVRNEDAVNAGKLDERRAPHRMAATPEGRRVLRELVGATRGWKSAGRGRDLAWARMVVDRYSDGHDTLHDWPGCAPFSDYMIRSACEALDVDIAEIRLLYRASRGDITPQEATAAIAKLARAKADAAPLPDRIPTPHDGPPAPASAPTAEPPF
jgi:hypothetical protein